MKAIAIAVLLVGCTSEPAIGPASVTVSSGIPIRSSYALRASNFIAFSDRAPGTACADIEHERSIDAYHDQLLVELDHSDATFPVAYDPSPGHALLKIYDDCAGDALACYDTTAGFHSGTVTVRWGEDSVTGTIDAHGTSLMTPDLVVSGTFEAGYCD